MSAEREVYLIIGGSGFLGRHIVEQLKERGDPVAVFDIVQRHDDVPFYSGDISDEEQVSQAIQKSGATCLINTASPVAGVGDAALYWKVNVDGTQAVINACTRNGIKKLVYTSSAGVVFNGDDIIDVDERLPPPEKAMDAYNESKAKAEELVLQANGKDGLWTVALRPAGIFGPGDRQATPGFAQVLKEGKSHFQVGDNNNLFDWTYVGNVAYAHILAAQKLIPPPSSATSPLSTLTLEEKEDILCNYALPSVDLTTGKQRIPTSDARPLGPYVEKPENADELLRAFKDESRVESRPVVRSRFDPFSHQSLLRAEVSPLQVAGNAFYITNCEPVPFWDFPRALWRMMAPEEYPSKKKNFVLSRSVGLVVATLAEWWGWATGSEPTFTKYKVTYTCVNRWYSVEKARRVLGYEPQVGLEEGMKRTVEWWRSQQAKSQ